MNRCAARGCGRWTRADETFCQRHRGVDQRQVLEQASDIEDEAGRESFAARLSAGDYASLLPPGLRDALRQASADAGLEAEIGALRVALLRLLQEERDPSRMAAGIARVAGVALQALRLQQAGSAGAPELRLVVVQELLTIEAEAAKKQNQKQKRIRKNALELGSGEGGDDHDLE
jgi:hypothetical protein